MNWVKVSFAGVALEGISRADFDAVWAPHMELWCPSGVPEGVPYYRLIRLRYVADLANQFDPELAKRQAASRGGVMVPMGMHVYVQREGGAPDPNIVVIQHWWDSPVVLAEELLPLGGLPPAGLNNHGNHSFADARGVCEWTWGAGEGFDPMTTRGAHSYWVTRDDAGKDRASDVVIGFGWRYGTNHFHLEPVFERTEGVVEPPPGPGDGKVAAALHYLFLGLAEEFEHAARMLEE